MGFFSDLADLGKDIGKEFSNLGKELKTIGKETVEEIKNDPGKYAFESAKDIAIATGKLAKFTATEVVPSMLEDFHKEIASRTDKQLQRQDISPEQKERLEEINKKAKEESEKYEEKNIRHKIAKAEEALGNENISDDEKLRQECLVSNSEYALEQIERRKRNRSTNQ